MSLEIGDKILGIDVVLESGLDLLAGDLLVKNKCLMDEVDFVLIEL